MRHDSALLMRCIPAKNRFKLLSEGKSIIPIARAEGLLRKSAVASLLFCFLQSARQFDLSAGQLVFAIVFFEGKICEPHKE